MLITRPIFLLIAALLLLLPLASECQVEATTDKKINLETNSDEMEFEKADYPALIGSQYISRFSELSNKLEISEQQLESIQRQIARKRRKFEEAESKATKADIKDEIKDFQIEVDKYYNEIKLIKKGLRLLQTNKSKSDPIKLNTLNQINDIENEISLLQNKRKSRKKENLLSTISIEERDSYMDPPPNDCKLIYNDQEPNTKKFRKEVEKEFLFGYTHPKLKPYFKDKHFLTCEAKIVQLNNKNFLWLYITIASKDAIKNYGYIEKSSPLKIELIDGEILYAPNIQNSTGKLEAYTGNTNYLVMLPLDKSSLRQLEKSEIDKIGIMWSSGYEQYEIYHVDLVMNQIECIKNN